MTIKERLKKFRWFYYSYREIVKRNAERKREWKYAVERFEEEKPEKGSLADYKKALFRHGVTYEEYMYCFEFWNKDEKQRKEYVSLSRLWCMYRKIVLVSVLRNAKNKTMCLQTFEKYVSRKWLYPKEVTYEAFKVFVNTFECIAKPVKGSLGKGIFMVEKGDEVYMKKLYAFCCEYDFFIEELLKGNKEMEEFHPKSLNTIRVLTISKDDRCELVAAAFRMGVGDGIIDNGSSGGVMAPIDINTGIVMKDGRDNKGNTYSVHPDSGKTIKGFAIPQWPNIVSACKNMSKGIDKLAFAGWDICVCDNGRIELVELNSYPSMTMMQTASLKGLKPRLCEIGKEVLGYDPVKLISVWSKSYVKYDDVYGRTDDE